MALDKQSRRLTLRDMLTSAEKHTRDLIDKVQKDWLAKASDLRDLSRPMRKRSPYPTLLALKHALENMLKVQDEMANQVDNLLHEVDEIRDQVKRERLGRG